MERKSLWFTRVQSGRVEIVLDNNTRNKEGQPNLIVIGSFLPAYSYHAERVCDYENWLIQNNLERVWDTVRGVPVAALAPRRSRKRRA